MTLLEMKILERLSERNEGRTDPFLISSRGILAFSDISSNPGLDLSEIKTGDVVALVGDFDGPTIATMLELLDRGVVLMPLTEGTKADHDYFFESGRAEWVIRDNRLERLAPRREDHPLIEEVRHRSHPGIIFFSSGTTGRPKAILHDFNNFLERYAVQRPPLRALNFLLFDHAGGINTMLHTLFNRGVVIVPSERTPERLAANMVEHRVELLPTTPTFLRMMLLSGVFETMKFPELRVIT